MSFLDAKKAFDRVNHWTLAKTPLDRNVPLHIVKLFIFVLLLLFIKVGSARLRVSDIHPISPKTSAPQFQPIDRKKRKGKRVEDL